MPKPTPITTPTPTPTHVPRELYTIPETMRAMHVSRDTVYKLMDAGELPTVYIGRARRIRHADIVAYIDAHVDGNGKPARARARKRRAG